MTLMKRLSEHGTTPSSEHNPSSIEHTSFRRGSHSGDGSSSQLFELIEHVQTRILNEVDSNFHLRDAASKRCTIDELLTCIIAEEGLVLSRAGRKELLEKVVHEVIGFGPLEPLLEDSATTDIMVVGPDRVYVERDGKISRTIVTFRDRAHLTRIIDRILAPLGRRVDESSPTVDARLPDGSRVNVVIPPVALDGPVLTIRKFSVVPLSVEDLISFGTASREVFEFLYGAVMAGLNIIVSGGSSSGKTTLLNVLSGFVPENERIVTIENAAELQLRQRHVVRMESRPPNIEEEGEITIRDLVINSLRMRPDRIVVGEVRSAEAIDLLQAMNTGHEGSMGTLHANSPHDALSRLETMVLGAGLDLPVRAIREQMASAINLLIQMGRDRNGVRRVLTIAEVEGMEMDTISLSDLFRFERVPGSERGRLIATGIIPRAIDRIADAGVRLSPALFEPPAWIVPSQNIPTIQSSDYDEQRESDGSLFEEYSLPADSQVEIAVLPPDEPMIETLAPLQADSFDSAPVEAAPRVEEAEPESSAGSESPCLPEAGHGLLSHLRHDDQTDLEPESPVTNESPCLPEARHGLLSHLRHDDQPDV